MHFMLFCLAGNWSIRVFVSCVNETVSGSFETPLRKRTRSHTHTHTQTSPLTMFIKRSLSHFSLSSAVLSFANFSGVIANWCSLRENLPPRCCLLKTSWNERQKGAEGAKRKMERRWRRRGRQEVGCRWGGVRRLQAAVKPRVLISSCCVRACKRNINNTRCTEWIILLSS